MIYDFDIIKAALIKEISPKRYTHSLGVMESAGRLAKIYGVDIDKASVAGLLHDCGKLPGVGDLEHGELGARLSAERYGVSDDEVLAAIRWHTTGRPGMTLLEKIIYIADKIEPNRNYEGVDGIRRHAYNDIDKAITDSLQNTVNYLDSKGVDIDRATIDTLDYFRQKEVMHQVLDHKKIELILKSCDDKKAFNFVVLDVSKISSITDFFVICSANNDKQAEAIGEAVLSMAAKEGFDVLHKEGFDTARWILIELDGVIVHIFQRDERDVYDLESLWTDNNSVDVEQFGIKNWV